MGLLERLLERAISEHAGAFVSVNREHLRVGVLRGEVQLADVQLKAEAVNAALGGALGPVRIRACRVGRLRAKIPWNELSSRPVRVTLSDVEVVLENASAQQQQQQGESVVDSIKRKRLEAAEIIATEHLNDPEEEGDAAAHPAKTSLMQRILTRIGDNIQVHVENLCVRFEDGDAAPPYAFELRLAGLALETVSSVDGVTPQFVDRTTKSAPPLKRRVSLTGLAMFWERPPSLRRVLLAPVGSITAVITQTTLPLNNHVDVKAVVQDELLVHLDVDVVQDVLALSDRASAYDLLVTQNHLQRFRPKQSPKVDPIGWWQYAIRCVRKLVVAAAAGAPTPASSPPSDGTTATLSGDSVGWMSVMRAVRQRWRYVMLYKRRLIVADGKFQARARKHSTAPQASSSTTTSSTSFTDVSTAAAAEEAADLARFAQMTMLGVALTHEEQAVADSVLAELELELPLTSIMLFRSFAEAEYREERQRLKKLHHSKRLTHRAVSAVVSASSYSRKALLGRFRGSTRAPPPSATPAATAPPPNNAWALDDRERQLLYEKVMATPETEFLMQSLASPSGVRGAPPPLGVDVSLARIVFRMNAPGPVMDLSFGGLAVKLNHDVGPGPLHVEKWTAKAVVEFMGLTDLLAAQHNSNQLGMAVSSFTSLTDRGSSKRLVEVDVDLARALSRPRAPRKSAAGTSSGAGAPPTHVDSLRVVVDVGPTRLVLTLDLLSRVFALAAKADKDRYVSNIAPHTVEMIKVMRARTQANRKFLTLPQDVNVKLDWDLPVVRIPVPGQATTDAYEVNLGRCRVRTTAAESVHMELHGVQVNHVGGYVTAAPTITSSSWPQASSHHPILDTVNVDAAFALSKWTLNAQVTPDITLRLPPTVQGLSALIQTGITLSELVPTTSTSAKTKAFDPTAASALSAFLQHRNFALTLAVPKVEVSAMVPNSRPGLRKRRKGWGDQENLFELLPAVGQVKVRIGNVFLSNSSLRVGSIHVRDDVQRAGASFRDLVAMEEPGLELAWQVPVLTTSNPVALTVRGTTPIRLAWNPSTVDAMASFVLESLDRVHFREGPPPPPSLPATPPPVTVNLILPEVSLSLNQETIASRLAVIRLVRLHVATARDGGASVRLHDVLINGVQWEPLTSSVGVQLLGRGMAGDDDSALPEDEDFLSLDFSKAANRVSFVAKHVRFLWVHTLTKQVADYVTDGIVGLIPPRAPRHHSPPPPLTQHVKATAPPPSPPPLVIAGQVHNAVVVVPALRFGAEFRYRRGGNTDELQALGGRIDIGVTVFPPNPSSSSPAPSTTCWRSDEPGGAMGDATATHCRRGPETSHPPHEGPRPPPAVEITMEFHQVDIRAVHRGRCRFPVTNLTRRPVSGRLAWNIRDFTPVQRQARARGVPLTYREQVRLDHDRDMGGIPFGEHPHGVSPQKFELFVDIDQPCVMEWSASDIQLIGVAFLENVLDHRRRLARVDPPKLPLFSESDLLNADNADEFASGPDELVGGSLGEVMVNSAHRLEVAARDVPPSELAREARAFGGWGEAPCSIVDLDLSFRIPRVQVFLNPGFGKHQGVDAVVAELNAQQFEMSLSEFYDRTQYVEVSAQQVRVVGFAATPPTTATGTPPPQRVTLVHVTGATKRRIHPSPPIRVREENQTFSRQSRNLSVCITRFPGKDRRIEVGVDNLILEPNVSALMNIATTFPINDAAERRRQHVPGGGGPRKVLRAEVVDVHLSKFSVRWKNDESTLILGGCGRILLAKDRAAAMRALLELRIGVLLRTPASRSAAEGAGVIATFGDVAEEEEEDGAGGGAAGGTWDWATRDPQSKAQVKEFLRYVYTTKDPWKLSQIDALVNAFGDNWRDLVKVVRDKYRFVPATPSSSSVARRAVARHSSRAPPPPALQNTSPSSSGPAADVLDHSESVLDPVGLRVDVSLGRARDSDKRLDGALLVEPMRARLTNGQIQVLHRIVARETLQVKSMMTTTTAPTRARTTPALGTSSSKLVAAARLRAAQLPPLGITALFQGLEVSLINDYGSAQPLPFLRLECSGLGLKVRVDEDQRGEVSCNLLPPLSVFRLDTGPFLRVDYFNPRILAWEALFEPWAFELSFTSAVASNIAPPPPPPPGTTSSNSSDPITPPKFTLQCRSEQRLDLNLTYSFVESLAYFLACRAAQERGLGITAGAKQHEHYVVNETGTPLRFWAITGAVNASGDLIRSEPCRLNPRDRAPLKLGSSEQAFVRQHQHYLGASTAELFRDTRDMRIGDFTDRSAYTPTLLFRDVSVPGSSSTGGPSTAPSGTNGGASGGSQGGSGNHMICVQWLEGGSGGGEDRPHSVVGELQNVPVDFFGSSVYAVRNSKVMVDVSLAHGSKTIRLSSPVHVRNTLSIPLVMLLTPPNGGAGKPVALYLPPTQTATTTTASGGGAAAATSGAVVAGGEGSVPVPVDLLMCDFRVLPVLSHPPSGSGGDEDGVGAGLGGEDVPGDTIHGLHGPELDAEAARVLVAVADATGYDWSEKSSLTNLHTMAERGAMLVSCPRAKALSYNAANQTISTRVVPLGGGTQHEFALLLDVDSFAASDVAMHGVKEMYTMTLSPLLRVENRLPVPLLARSLGRLQEEADVPLMGARLDRGEDCDVMHVVRSRVVRRRSSATNPPLESSSRTAPATPGGGGLGDAVPASSSPATTAASSLLQSDPLAQSTPTPPTTAATKARPAWLNLTVPDGFGWCAAFQPVPTGIDRPQILVLQQQQQQQDGSHPVSSARRMRLMYECERCPSGMLRVTVFVEAWLVNDVKMGLAYRDLGTVGGEHLIYELGHRFKDRGGAAAQRIIEIGATLRERTQRALKGNKTAPLPVAPTPGSAGNNNVVLEEEHAPTRERDRDAAPPPPPSEIMALLSDFRLMAVRLSDAHGRWTNWSSVVNLDTVAASCDIAYDVPYFGSGSSEYGDPSVRLRGVVGLTVRSAPGKFRRSRVVSFQPRYVFVNRLGGDAVMCLTSLRTPVANAHALTAVQAAATDFSAESLTLCVGPGESVPMHFFEAWEASVSSSRQQQQQQQQSTAAGGEASDPPVVMVSDEDASARFGALSGPKVRVGFRVGDAFWGWSGAILVNEAGETCVKVRDALLRETRTLRVVVQQVNVTSVVTVMMENPVSPLYRILNASSETVHFYQLGVRDKIVERLFPGESRVFGWDEPSLVLRRAVIVSFRGDSRKYECEIDALSGAHVLTLSRPHVASVAVSVQIRGVTKTLVIADSPLGAVAAEDSAVTSSSSQGTGGSSHDLQQLLVVHEAASSAVLGGPAAGPTTRDRRPSRALSLVRKHSAPAPAPASAPPLSVATAEPPSAPQPLFSFTLELAHVGISIVDRAPQELLYVSLTRVHVDFLRTLQRHDDDHQSGGPANVPQLAGGGGAAAGEGQEQGIDVVDFSIHALQVDNQVQDAVFPVLLRTLAKRPVVETKVVRRFGHGGEFEFCDFFSFALRDTELKLEDTTLLLLGRMAWECAMSLRSEEEIILGKVLLDKEGGALRRLRKWFGVQDAEEGGMRHVQVAHVQDDLGEWLEAKRFRLPARLGPKWSSYTGAALGVVAGGASGSVGGGETKANGGTGDGTPGGATAAGTNADTGGGGGILGRRVYFRVLHLHPVHVNLSFRFTAMDPVHVLSLSRFRVASAIRGEAYRGGPEVMFDADSVAALLPPALTNIDGARIRLYALVAPHVLSDAGMLSQTVSRHYGRQALTQVYRIVGSSDLIGNPLGAMQELSVALSEFVGRPAEGLSRASPSAFVRGVGSGTAALLRHTVLGTFDTMAKLSGALGAGVALLSLDHRFIAERWTQLRFEQPSGLGSGLLLGVRGFANSLVDGASGVITRPVRSLETLGLTSGAAQELGLAVLGAGVKPVVGLLDLAGRTATGARNSIKAMTGSLTDRAGRLRLPRAFVGLERRMDAYEEEDAFVCTLLGAVWEAVVHAQREEESPAFTVLPPAGALAGEEEDAVVDYLGHVLLDRCFVLVLGGGRVWCLDWGVWIAGKRRPSPSSASSNEGQQQLADATVQNRDARLQLGRKARVWDVAMEDVVGVRSSREPAFPHVLLLVRTPGALVRAPSRTTAAGTTSTMDRGGAGQPELVVGDVTGQGVSRAAVRFEVVSHAKARAVERKVRRFCAAAASGAGGGGAGASPLSSPTHQQQQQQQHRVLGVALGPVPSSMMNLAGPGHVGGAGVVLLVVPDSPASRAGVRVGDIVVSCDGAVLDRDDPGSTLRKVVASLTGRSSMTLHVVRPQHKVRVALVVRFE